MTRAAMFAALLLCAAGAHADVVMGWSASARAIVVAHDGKVEAFDESGEQRLWSAEGLASPSSIVVSPDGRSAVILDGFEDRIAIVSIAAGQVLLHDTLNTPVAAAFYGTDVWVVLRDRRRVRRISVDGQSLEVGVALDPSLIAVSDPYVYVYSRAEGLLQGIDPKSGEVTRSVAVGAGASDLEIRHPRPGEPPGATAYLCRPANGTLTAVNLVTMKVRDIKIGDAPMDLAFAPFNITAVIADPGRQALFQSAHPGPGTPIRPPTPVDRLSIAGAGIFAHDGNRGTLYRVEGRTVTQVLSDIPFGAFVPTDTTLFTWDAAAGKPRRVP